MVGTFFCIASCLVGMILCWMDKTADKQEGKTEAVKTGEDMISMKDLKLLGVDYWIITISCVLNYMALFPF